MKKQHAILYVLVFAGLILSGLMVDAYGQLYRQRKGGYFYNDPNLNKKKVIDLNPFFEKKKYVHTNGDTLPYRILLPQNYDHRIAYPLVVYLHGSGERGNDNQSQLINGGPQLLYEKRKDYPAIVVAPQCPADQFWSDVDMQTVQENDSTKQVFTFPVSGPNTRPMEALLGLLPAIEKEYKIKPDQRYVFGLSMGGMATFELVKLLPDYFAAAMPICGGANPEIAPTIRHTAFWVFHGMLDDVLPYQLSEQIVLALQAIYDREEVVSTFYPQSGHNSWDAAFAEPDFLQWMFSKKRR